MRCNLPEFIDPYFIGLWLGDGDSDSIRITTPDREIISYIENYAKRIGLIAIKSRENQGKAIRISISHGSTSKNTQPIRAVEIASGKEYVFNSIVEAVNTLNLKSKSNVSHVIAGKYKFSEGYYFYKLDKYFANKLRKWFQDTNLLDNKHFPEFIFNLPEEDLIKILAGYIDSDGTKESNHKISISQKKEHLILGLEKICKILKLQSLVEVKTIKLKYKNYEKYEYYKIKIFGEDLENVPVLLERKKAKNLLQIKNFSI